VTRNVVEMPIFCAGQTSGDTGEQNHRFPKNVWLRIAMPQELEAGLHPRASYLEPYMLLNVVPQC